MTPSGLRRRSAELAELARPVLRDASLRRQRERVVRRAADRHRDRRQPIRQRVEVVARSRLARQRREQNAVVRTESAEPEAVADAGELRRAAADHLAREVERRAVAFLLLRDADESHEQLFWDEREVADGFEVEAIVVAERHGDHARVVTLRNLRDQANRAADAVLAEQRALRPAQHLDALEIDEIHVGARDRAVVDVVDVDTDSGLEREAEVDLVQAAQADRVVRAEVARVAAEIGIRDHEADVLDVLDAADLELLARERRDRDRRRLDVLLAITRGDDDFLEPGLLRPALCARLALPCRALPRRRSASGVTRTSNSVAKRRSSGGHGFPLVCLVRTIYAGLCPPLGTGTFFRRSSVPQRFGHRQLELLADAAHVSTRSTNHTYRFGASASDTGPSSDGRGRRFRKYSALS